MKTLVGYPTIPTVYRCCLGGIYFLRKVATLKILLINKFFYPRGGAETVFFQERGNLKRAGYEVLEFAMRHPDNLASDYDDYFVPYVEYRHAENEKAEPGFIKKLFIARNFVYNHQAVTQLDKLIRREKPAIAHLHNIYHQISPAIIPLLKKSGIKIILTLHDYKLICPVYNMLRHDSICRKCQGKKFWHVISGRCEGRSISRSMLLAAEAYWHFWRRSYEQVDLFLSPSKFMAAMMVHYRLQQAKVKVLHNGIDCDRLAPWGGEDGHYALFVGRLLPEKGVETFLEACRQLGWPLPVKVVGTGPQLEKLRKQYPQVEFTGFKIGRELEDIYRRATFVVVPSEWYENCSMVILEAMAHGKPVIGSRIGGIPEQVDDGVTGLLFTVGNRQELASKIDLLRADTSLCRRLGLQARKKLEREYSLENHCHQLMTIYKNVYTTS